MMTEITKCANGCERQNICYRWTVLSDKYWQSYVDFKPNDDGVCDSFYSNKSGTNNV